jgi:hypothetical protein
MANELKHKCVKIFSGSYRALKIKSTIMQKIRIVQAVALMLIVAMAASCAASKEYTSKLFTPRIPSAQDSQAVTLRFLEIGSTDTDKEGWVTTDIIMGRDTVSNTLALDKLSRVFPATSSTTTDSTVKTEPAKTTAVIAQTKTILVESEPVAKNANPGEVRNKKTRE